MPALSLTSAPPTNDPNLPSYTRPEAAAALPDLGLVHDLLAGTRRLWAQAKPKKYIQKWAKEKPAVYDIRSTCETVFEGLGRTLSAATGMLFAKPPQITWNASEVAMTADLQNVDAQGTAFNVFAKRFAEAGTRDGLGLLVIDHPPAPVDEHKAPIPITAENEARFNLRPTWASYARAQILSWRTAVVNNQTVPVLVVLAEAATEASGEFGIEARQRYRVLRLVNVEGVWQAEWELLELQSTDATKRASYVRIDSGVFRNKNGAVRDTLPIAIAYTGRTDAPFCASIPLLGVAWANLAHWQIATDLRFYRMCAAFPQPTIVGQLASDPQTGKPTELALGPLAVVNVVPASQGGTASFTWTEVQGTSMEQQAAGVHEKLVQMAQLGMSFLVPDARAAETAEAKRLDAVAENSTLATAAQGIEDALNLALEIHAWYRGIEKQGAPTVQINRDYETIALDAQVMQAYAQLVVAGFPKRPVLEALQVGGRIASDKDLEALQLEWEEGVQAVAEQQRLDALASQPNQPTPNAKDDPTRAGSSPPAMTIEYGANGRPARLVPAA